MTNADFSTPETLSPQQKKLLFRAWHRGTREADLLMGRFAEAYLPGYDTEMLTLFEELLDQTDPDIFDWVSGRLALPDHPCAPILNDLIAFYKTDQ